MNRCLLLILALATGLAACSATGPGASARPDLVGTTWELVAIQSMDDAQGTTAIADPKHFSVSFAANGQASFRLDCNRGRATWQATPAADGTTGTLRFGPVATTRAMCPPPHLDQRVARDLAFVRGYLFKDGRLFLSLMADGGVYEWRPAQ